MEPTEPMHIVVGVDGSPQAREAVRWASRMATELGGDIVVVHALGLLEQLHGELVAAHARRAEIREIVEREWCSSLRRDGAPGLRTGQGGGAGVDWKVVVRDGAPVDVLLGVAAEEDADLVVMGSRGIGGAPAMALGSSSLHVLQNASLPVLVVPERENSVGHLGLRRVLVAVNGSQTSHAAVDVACRVAVAFGSWINLVEAIEDVPVFPLGPAVRDSSEGEIDAPERARTTLEAVRQRMRECGVPVHIEVERGAPHEVVRKVAAAIDADLVVLGCRRAGADADLLAGSVSRQVAGVLHRPTLVVPEGYQPEWTVTGERASGMHPG
jgi:nucleotide-binding universal stress UspA family protein